MEGLFEQMGQLFNPNQELKKVFVIDFSKIDNVEFGGIDHSDYPDFSDAYIEAADYDGEPMSDEMLEEINCNHPDYVYEKLMKKLF